jgi:hypothetical protein
MLVPLEEVAFCNWQRTMDAVAKFRTGIAASVVGTNKFCTMLDILWNHKVSSLKQQQNS